MEQHEGTIEAQSEGIGKGSVFTITLPVMPKPEPETETAPKPNLNASVLDKRKILVVDDNVDSANTLSRMLGLVGHECVLAHNGHEALDKAREHDPDVILLDIGLPDTTGYEVCRKMREDERFSRTLIIAQTGWGQERDIERSRQAGFDHHLVKPLELDALNSLLAAPAKH